MVLTDTLPGQVSFKSSSEPDDCVHNAGQVTCSLDDMAPGDSLQVDISVDVNTSASGTLQNQSIVNSDTPDPVTNNNNDGENTTVDAELPQVEWIYPKNGDIVYVVGQVIQLRARATDDVAVERVRFYRWDPPENPGEQGEWIKIGDDTIAPYDLYFDTSVLNPTYNELRILAVDSLGRWTEDNKEITRTWLYLTYMYIHLPLVFQ